MSEAAFRHGDAEKASDTVARESGRYAIEQEGESPAPQPSAAVESIPEAVMTPSAAAPAVSGRAPAGSYDLSIHALSQEELSWIESRASQRPSNDTAMPARAVFAKEGEEPAFDAALQPFYREPTLERVQLQFQDLSLDPSHNPLALSSLVPPAKRSFASVQRLAIGVGALALVSVGYLAALATRKDEPVATTEIASARAPREGDGERVVAKESEERAARLEVPAATTAPTTTTTTTTNEIGSESETLVEYPWSVPEQAAQEAAPADKPAAPSSDATAAAPSSARRLALLRARALAAKAANAKLGPEHLPLQPSREQIRAGVEQLRAALQTCAGPDHGLSTARITITGAGRVANATIEGAFAGTPAGSCMARALRTAGFPPFASATLQVTYPFRL